MPQPPDGYLCELRASVVHSHTGYAQVLESVTNTGKVTSYTIGDDVLLQSTRHSLGDGGPITFDNQYFLPDGHPPSQSGYGGTGGSTRQLADSTGTVTAQYSFDSYGLMLGTQSGSQPLALTSLLFAGESFDTSLQQYNLRARHYDPSNGRFNRLDPFSGSQYDPQSLHKYAYCHSDPVNNVDPSGEMSLGELSTVSALIGLLTGIATFSYAYIVQDKSLGAALMSGLVAALMTAFFIFFAPEVATGLAAMALASTGGALFVSGLAASALTGLGIGFWNISNVLAAGKNTTWQQKAAALALALTIILTAGFASRVLSEGVLHSSGSQSINSKIYIGEGDGVLAIVKDGEIIAYTRNMALSHEAFVSRSVGSLPEGASVITIGKWQGQIISLYSRSFHGHSGPTTAGISSVSSSAFQ